MFKKTKVCSGVLLALGGAVMATSMPAFAQDPQRVEITGSRIKRVDAEGALPITVIDRATIESSGSTTIAEFMRSMTFASAGNFRPQSGSSGQSFAGADLRGLGDARTLILLDGRRLPKAPNIGDSTDTNSIPMAAIDRIEILTDGASAIYGSDAIAGVINFVTRKDFQGVNITAGYANPVTDGGAKQELSGIIGTVGDKGRILGGFSRTHRGMVFTRDRPWGQTLGVSSYGNNYRRLDGIAPTALTAVPGACTDTNFYLTGAGTCSFNFNAVAADEAEITNTAFFVRGETRINDDWSAYLSSSVSRVESFGRYAPTPGQVTVAADSPNNPTNGATDIVLRHRFAAAGNRDTFTDGNLYEMGVGVQGRIANSIDVDVGVSSKQSKYAELGYNFIVRPLAEQYINSGEYDIYTPSANSPDILNAIKATISRNSSFKQLDVYGTASFPLFQMGGGSSMMLVGLEHRTEDFVDQYDSLQEAGVIEGSAGNSSGGDRTVNAVLTEILFPISKTLEATFSARYEKYSDYGNDFSPKVSAKWKALPNLSLRASFGKGFRAPSLPVLTQKTQFSAESVFDPATCIAFGGDPVACNTNTLVQVDTYDQANAQLKSEKSTQFSVGSVWDITPALSLKLDYWNIKIDDVISQVTAGEILDRDQGIDPRPIPAGLGVQRDPVSGAIIRIDTGWANEGTLKTSGLDFDVLFSWGSGGMGKFGHNFRWSHMFTYDTTGGDLAGSQGLPKDRATLSNTWTLGAFDAAWNVNYIGKNGDAADSTNTNAYTTHDVQLNWTPPIKGSKLTVGVTNLTNSQPALIPYDGRNFNFYLYDSYGRTPYVRFSQKF
jgi:iron complex outermembrane receptor protein